MCLWRHLHREAIIIGDIKSHATLRRAQITHSWRRDGMRQRSLVAIREEAFSKLLPKAATGFAVFRPRRTSLARIRTFQVMVARGFFEQVLDRWRHVVDWRPVDTDDLLGLIELIARTQL